MRRIKRLLTSLFMFLFVITAIPITAFAEEAPDDKILVYAQVPDDWSDPYIWAWDDDGTNAFEAWAGEAMEADTNNEGWYYCWIPNTATNIIINANDSAVQTADQKIEAKNAWLTITDADNVSISYDAQTQGDIPEYVETFKIHAQVPDSWEDVCLWAWSAPDGTNAFEAWPGKTMTQGDDGWYTASAPVWVNSIIIDGNNGDVKTEDLSIDAAEIWVTVADDGNAEFTYDDPNAVEAEDISVRVKVPDDWNEPHLWAWSAPDGTNAFSAWPGEPLEDTGDGWMTLTVPGWINSVIVNANDGEIQTGDLSVDAGKDLWIVVTDADNAEVTYEEPATEDTAASDSTAEDASDDSSSFPVAAVVVILVVVVIAVIAIVVFVNYKKKKK